MKRSCYAYYQGWDQIARKRKSTLPSSREPWKIDWNIGVAIKKLWEPSARDPLVPVVTSLAAWKKIHKSLSQVVSKEAYNITRGLLNHNQVVVTLSCYIDVA